MLVQGETGTGKELVAKLLHDSSGRTGPWMALNCAALSSELLESELFGHVKGSFTGALLDKAGLLEAASGGTVFFDEIGEMATHAQAKLLRAVQSGEIRPVGSNKIRHVDAWLIAATNRDLESEVRADRFRADLFERFAFRVTVPPLRERQGDIDLLVEHFLEAAADEHHLNNTLTLSDEAHRLMRRYRWPGNVRELEYTINRAIVLAEPAGVILPEHLPDKVQAATDPSAGPSSGGVTTEGKRSYNARTRAETIAAMERHRGDKRSVAKELGINLSTVYRRLKKFGIGSHRRGREDGS